MLLCYIIFHLFCCVCVYKLFKKLFPDDVLYEELFDRPEAAFLFLLSMILSPLMAVLLWLDSDRE